MTFNIVRRNKSSHCSKCWKDWGKIEVKNKEAVIDKLVGMSLKDETFNYKIKYNN